MKIHTLIAAPLMFLALSLPAAAEKLSLDAISKYFNGIRTAQTAFMQYNADGTTSKGTLFMKRPGRIRFEYAAPDKTVVMAGGGKVAIFDKKSNQPPEQYPLKRTPLNLILANNINLGKAKMVVGHEEFEGKTVVTAQDPEHPEYGTIQMVFSANPVALREWVIYDEGGSQTRVVLDELELGVKLSTLLFNITYETELRQR